MKICPYCGNQVPDTARYCSECGNRIMPDSFADADDDLAQNTEAVPYDEEEEYEESWRGEPDDEDGYPEEEDDPEERPVRRYRKTYEEEEEEYVRENRKTLTVGIILAALICVVGIGLYLIVSHMLKQEPKIDVGTGLHDKTVQVTVAPTQEPDKDQQEALPEADVEEENTSEDIQAQVLAGGPALQPGYQQAVITESQGSSVLEDGGVYHVSAHMIDGRPETSWQEASDGDGSGEWTQFQFDRSYRVRYITFMLGNWKSEQLFYANNRPQTISLRLDDKEFILTFPDGMQEYTVELSGDCEASGLFLQVLNVYNGASWSDCCISEMRVYGE